MRILLRTEGGFAPIIGRAKPFIIDSADLPPQEAEELRQLVEEAHFFELPSTPAPERGADYRKYTITIEDAHQTHTVTCTDPVSNVQLQKLIDFMQRHKIFNT